MAQREQARPRTRVRRQPFHRDLPQVPQVVAERRLQGPQPLVLGRHHFRERTRCPPALRPVIEHQRDDRRQRPQLARPTLRVHLQDAYLVIQHLQRSARVRVRLVLQQRVHEARLAVLQLHLEQLVALAAAQILVHEAAVQRHRELVGQQLRLPRFQVRAQHGLRAKPV